MGSAIGLREGFDGSRLRSLAKATRHAGQARRLLALAAIYDGGSRSDAARTGGVMLQIVRDWVLRFNAGGLEGLIDRKAPGNVSKLGDDRRRALSALVESGPIPAGVAIEFWWQDEARVGQKNKITRRWARRGTRPRAPRDQRTKSAYIFGAICPQQGKAAGLVLPFCNTTAMNLHLHEVSRAVSPGAHAVVLLDQAGWHTAGKLTLPDNIALLMLPSRAPELSPVENVRQFMRDNRLSNRIFNSYDAILSHCCDAWNNLVDQPWQIMAIGARDWAHRY